MNNIQLIQEDYAIGDAIRISCSLGLKEGYIVEFFEDRIKLRPYESGRKPFSIQNSTITDWEEGLNNLIDNDSPISTNDHQPIAENSSEENNIETGLTLSTQQEEQSNTPEILVEPEIPSEVKESQTQSEIPQPKPLIGVKKVGYIPLEELLNIDPNLKKKKKMTTIGKDFSSLESLLDPEDLARRELYIPPRGEIATVPTSYGFIYDSKLKKRIYFSSSQIIDPEIKIHQAFEQPVVYQIEDSPKGPKAIGIHKPSKVGRLIGLATTLSKDGKCLAALQIIKNILDIFPDNTEAERIKKELSTPLLSMKTKSFPNYQLYAMARKAQLEGNDNVQAIDLYEQAISQDVKRESSIKDLCWLLVQIYKASKDESDRTKALDAMNKYKGFLSHTLNNLNFLLNFYFTLDDYPSFDEIEDKLLELPALKNNNKRRSEILSMEAMTYYKQEDYKNAKSAAEEALGENSENQAAKKLLDLIENPAKKDESESMSKQIFPENLILLQSSMNFSSYIMNTIDSYNEYYGVAERVKVGDSLFTLKTLKDIRNSVEKLGSSKSRERAKYLLTQAKLLSYLEPDDMQGLKSVMARYCNAMALNHLSDNSHLDVVRFFFLEAFSLESNYDSVARQVSSFLQTYVCSVAQILNTYSNQISVDEALTLCISRNENTHFWDDLLDLALHNSDISAHLVSALYQNEVTREPSIAVLRKMVPSQNNNVHLSKSDFFRMWEMVCHNRENEKATFRYKFDLFETRSLEDFSALYLSLTKDLPTWLPELDLIRFSYIVDRILPPVDAYLKSSGYSNKETNFTVISGHIQQLVAEIEDQPTQVSYNIVLPLILRLKDSLNKSFEDVKQASEPKLTVYLLSTEAVIRTGNIVTFQIAVSNSKESSPIRQVKAAIEESAGIYLEAKDSEIMDYNALYGGADRIFKLSAKVDSNLADIKAFPVTIIVNYETNGFQKEFRQQIALKLYSPDDYKSISNPYAPIADGGPVPLESNMFFGRQQFINNIVSSFKDTPSKQVIIYGQKRCGKSSVLLHLKDALQKEGNFFCTSFSIGEIIQNLNECSFYYKILSSIKSELEDWEFDHPSEVIPNFEIPNISDFMSMDSENPLNTFITYIKRFKRECKTIEGFWNNVSLVVMIDEFTYLYTGIKKGVISDSIMKQWKAITQNPQTQFSVVLVGQDVIPSFKKEDYARNAFGVIEDKRLTYLNEIPARELIENPIRLENGDSRYVGGAVDRIIDYTSRNPYYIQIFCARLVDYLNNNKSVYATVVDVDDVAATFIKGEQALDAEKFDNLIRPGESEDMQEFKDEDVLKILKQMAALSNIRGFCRIQELDALQDKSLTYRIMNNLHDREVIENVGDDKYRIQVKLFQEWLLNH